MTDGLKSPYSRKPPDLMARLDFLEPISQELINFLLRQNFANLVLNLIEGRRSSLILPSIRGHKMVAIIRFDFRTLDPSVRTKPLVNQPQGAHLAGKSLEYLLFGQPCGGEGGPVGGFIVVELSSLLQHLLGLRGSIADLDFFRFRFEPQERLLNEALARRVKLRGIEMRRLGFAVQEVFESNFRFHRTLGYRDIADGRDDSIQHLSRARRGSPYATTQSKEAEQQI